MGAVAANLPDVLASWQGDLTLLQREMISTLVTLEPFTKGPRVLDVDDAIFLYRQGRAAKRLAELCEVVICGNAYLGDWFSQFNKRIELLPTAVDTERYAPRIQPGAGDGGLTLGWIGTSGNLKYLTMIEEALLGVLDRFPRVCLRVISDRPPDLGRLPSDRWVFHRWTPESEVAQIQGMDIGLMPLEDSPWARGKCSFKMLQYLACGVPVVVSPVGMNQEVLLVGEVGLGARNSDEWAEALATLISDDALRHRLGAQGRAVVETKYSVRALAPKMASILKRVGR
jgi:glycosyltransferase involved in cell wall biosynthesis